MRKLTADFFVSIDGFASDAEGTQNWIHGLVGPEAGQFIGSILSEPHELVIGRKTYEVLFGYWPNAKEPQAAPMNKLPKLVFSRTLRGPLEWNNARLAKGPLEETVKALKAESGPELRSIGSMELVRGLLDAGLVDRVRLLVFPKTLGTAGREPIFANHPMRKYRAVSSKVLDSNILLLEYSPADAAYALRSPLPARRDPCCERRPGSPDLRRRAPPQVPDGRRARPRTRPVHARRHAPARQSLCRR